MTALDIATDLIRAFSDGDDDRGWERTAKRVMPQLLSDVELLVETLFELSRTAGHLACAVGVLTDPNPTRATFNAVIDNAYMAAAGQNSERN